MGTQLPPQKKGDRAPKFSAYVYCGLTAGWIKIPLGMEVGLGPGHIVLDGDPAPLPQKGAHPQFSADVYCGQTAGWIKMPLGMEVGFSSGHIVLDGDPAPILKRDTAPHFLAFVYCRWMAGWIKMPLGAKVGLGPGHIVLHGNLASPHKGHSPQFSAHVYCGHAVAHLSYCWALV